MMKVNSNFHILTKTNILNKNDEIFREYREKWHSYPESFIVAESPLHLDIEVTNACNLKCPFCATTHFKYEKGFMKEDIWKKVLDEAGNIGVYSAKFNYRGEPLLHPDICEIVAYAKKSGLIDVYFNTNAVLLNDEMINGLIDAGLDRLSVSFEGFEKELYEKNRVGAEFEKVVSNIKRLQQIKSERGVDFPKVRVQTVLIPQLHGKEEQYLKFWEPVVDEVAYLDMKDEVGDHRNIVSEWSCPQLWQRMTIMWDGTLLPCCHDIFGWMAFGNVADLSIEECWQSSKENEYRRLHKNGLAHQIDACDRCPLRESEIKKMSNKEQ